MGHRRASNWLAAGTVAASVLTAGATAAAGPDAVITRVSVSSAGQQGNHPSYEGAISADGRYIAFASDASNLVPGDTNGKQDVFVHDRVTATTTRVSVGPDGQQGSDNSPKAAISADGRYVAFESDASNLVPGDTNGKQDVFVHDRATATTTRVSVGPGGRQANDDSLAATISADGRYIAFNSFASNLVPGDTIYRNDVFVHDRMAGTTTLISVTPGGQPGNGPSYLAAISTSGREVAFGSLASNLIPGDTNGIGDIFVRDRVAGTTTRVSVGPGGRQANYESFGVAISADGRYVAFNSDASNLVPRDTNGWKDVFVRDRVAGTTTRVSVGPDGQQVHRITSLVAISVDGRYVVFDSYAANLVPGDTNGRRDVFVRDRAAGTTTRVSVGPDGQQGTRHSYGEAISAGGRDVVFNSPAPNLVPGDTNGTFDVFVRSMPIGPSRRSN